MVPPMGSRASAVSSPEEGLGEPGEQLLPTCSCRARPCMVMSLSTWAEGPAGTGPRRLLWPVWGQPSPVRLPLAAAGSCGHCYSRETTQSCMVALTLCTTMHLNAGSRCDFTCFLPCFIVMQVCMGWFDPGGVR